MKINLHRSLLAGLYLAGLGAVAFFGYRGFDYYRAPIVERLRHELYWELKPGAPWAAASGSPAPR